MILAALDAVCTVTTAKSVSRPHQKQSEGESAEAVIAAPVVLLDGRVWGALVAIGHSASMAHGAVGLVEHLARQVAAIFCGEVEAPPREDGMTLPWDEHFVLPCGRLHDVLLHELRAPLAAACYSLETLGYDELVWGNAALAQKIRTVQMGVQEAQRIMRWCSQLAAIDGAALPLHLEAVVVAETMRHAKELLPAATLSIKWVLAEPGLAVLADQTWLTQTCINLLENSVKHAQGTSVVLVEVRRQTADRVLTMVTTMGAGIAMDRQPLMFRPYGHEGTSDDLTSQGLGLAIAHYYVTRMGGEMWITSDGHSHTTIAFVLPSADGGAK